MTSKKSVEDYLESILLLGDHVHAVNIAEKNRISKAAVTKALRKLEEKGFVVNQTRHIVLTEEGKAYAKKVHEKHTVIKKFLMQMGVSEEIAESDACQAEHIFSEETLDAIRKNIVE